MAPRVSGWCLVDPAQLNVGVDVGDVVSGGAGAIVPVNAKVYGSYFSTGLIRDRGAGMCAYVRGYGAGAGLGAGWGVPFVGADAVGRIPSSLKRKVLESLGSELQGKAIDWLKNQAWDGVSGGTRLITGPDSSGTLTLNDFHDGFASIVSLGANFVVNGVSFGLLIFSRQVPVVTTQHLIYATAFGLMGGVGLATSLDVEATNLVYRLRVG